MGSRVISWFCCIPHSIPAKLHPFPALTSHSKVCASFLQPPAVKQPHPSVPELTRDLPSPCTYPTAGVHLRIPTSPFGAAQDFSLTGLGRGMGGRVQEFPLVPLEGRGRWDFPLLLGGGVCVLCKEVLSGTPGELKEGP